MLDALGVRINEFWFFLHFSEHTSNEWGWRPFVQLASDNAFLIWSEIA